MDGRSPQRRDVLQGVAAGLIAGAGLNWIRSTPTAPPPRVSDPARETAAAADPLGEEDTPYAIYQYYPWRGAYHRTLPINLVSPLEHATFEELIAVMEASRWYVRPAENARYAYDRTTESWRRSDWSAADTTFGIGGRVHVRCWHLDDTVSIQAHTDTPPSPGHRVGSYAEAAQAVVGMFANAGWQVDPETPELVDLGNGAPPDHDGRAVVIRR